MAEVVFILIMSLVNTAKGGMEGYIVGGKYANFADYAHSVFLTIEVQTKNYDTKYYGCGASILNQAILLTAAHCLEDCKKNCIITIHAGNKNREKGFKTNAKSFRKHENYDETAISNDICLVKPQQKLKLSKSIKRVVLMKKPPYKETAYVAGWGLVDDIKHKQALLIKSAMQRVWTQEDCLRALQSVPAGAFCAGEKTGKEFPADGDSGSALVVRKYIQIGLVSYKNPLRSRTLQVYTDVGYHYKWIKEKAKIMFCG